MRRSRGQPAMVRHSMRVQPCGPESARQSVRHPCPAARVRVRELVVVTEVGAAGGLDSIHGHPTLNRPQRATCKAYTTAARPKQSYSRRTSMKRRALFAAVVLAVAACAKSDEKAADTTPAAMAP